MPSFTPQWDTQSSTGFMLLKIALSQNTESAASRARVTYSIAWEKSRTDEWPHGQVRLSSTSKGSLKHGLGAASQRKARGARNRGGDDTTTETALCGSTSILHLQARRPNSDWQMQFARPLKWLALLRKFDCAALRHAEQN